MRHRQCAAGLVDFSGVRRRAVIHHLGRAALPDGALDISTNGRVKSKVMALCKALALTMAAASAHHVTLLFASVIFTIPVVVTAIMDRKRDGNDATAAGVVIRSAIFAGLTIVGIIVVLLPYWLALKANPIKQMPIPHGSRENFFSQGWLAVNYIIVPGAQCCWRFHSFS